MKRRRKGEGTWRVRADGSIEWRDPRTNKSYYATTERAMILKMREIIGADPERAKDGRLTVAAFLKTWLVHIKGRVRPNTYATYESCARIHILPALGKLRLSGLSPLDVQRLLDGVAGGRAAGTVRSVRVVLKMALARAVEWELARRNVAALVKPPKRARLDIRPLDEKELAAFHAAIAGHPYEALFYLAVSCGLRLGELRGLMWSDINLDASTLKVARTLQPVGVLETKTPESSRTIHLPKAAVTRLKAYKAQRGEWQLAAGAAWQGSEYLFVTQIGTSIDKRNLDRWYQRVLKAGTIPHHRFHDLRHTCATHLLVKGVAPKQVSQLLGHSTVAFTLQVYGHVLPSQDRAAADVMDDLLG